MSLLDLVNKRAKKQISDRGGLTEVPLTVRLMDSTHTRNGAKSEEIQPLPQIEKEPVQQEEVKEVIKEKDPGQTKLF